MFLLSWFLLKKKCIKKTKSSLSYNPKTVAYGIENLGTKPVIYEVLYLMIFEMPKTLKPSNRILVIIAKIFVIATYVNFTYAISDIKHILSIKHIKHILSIR